MLTDFEKDLFFSEEDYEQILEKYTPRPDSERKKPAQKLQKNRIPRYQAFQAGAPRRLRVDGLQRIAAIYDRSGRLTQEKWYDEKSNLLRDHQYFYDRSGNAVRKIDVLEKKEFITQYENGLLIYTAEYDLSFTGKEISERKLVFSARHTYDQNGDLVGTANISMRGVFYTFVT